MRGARRVQRASSLLLVAVVGAFGQDGTPGAIKPAPPAGDTAPPDTEPLPSDTKIDKRVFGVFPNYRTANGSRPFEPITVRQKFAIAVKDSADWPSYLVAGAFAALYQIENQNPSFG